MMKTVQFFGEILKKGENTIVGIVYFLPVVFLLYLNTLYVEQNLRRLYIVILKDA